MKVIKWVVVNVGFIALFYWGFIVGHDGAYNVTMFVAWASIAMSPFLLADACIAKLKERGRSVPAWINNGHGLLVSFAFVWFGAWVTGAFYLLSTIISESAWQKSEEINEG
jgi:hypothetical protein